MTTAIQPTTEAPVQQDGSVESAAHALRGLLSGSPEKQPPEKRQPEQATRPAESPEQASPEPEAEKPEIEVAKSETDAGDGDADVEQPPKHKLTIDGEEVEVTLEEALKGYSRHKDYTRKTQEIAEARKKFETEEVAAVRAERGQYQHLLTEFESALKTMTPTEPDWDKLKKELTPDQFASEVLGWQERSKSLEKIKAEKARVQALQDEDARKGFDAHVATEREKLVAKIPELKDPEKSKALMSDLVEFATVGLGYSPQEVQGVTDHRLVVLLHKAFLQSKAEKAAPKIQNKIERGLDTTPPGSRTKPAKVDELAAAKKRLKESGTVDDAAVAIRQLLKAEPTGR